MTTALLETPD